MNERTNTVAEASGDGHGPWASFITLKRTRSGYTWSIGVRARGSSLEELRAAAELAETIDSELAERHGDLASKAV